MSVNKPALWISLLATGASFVLLALAFPSVAQNCVGGFVTVASNPWGASAVGLGTLGLAAGGFIVYRRRQDRLQRGAKDRFEAKLEADEHGN